MRILAISAHPDDETLGCGGALLRHAADGDELHWLITTETYEPQWEADTIAAKRAEVDTVAAAYGMKEVCRLGFPTIRLDTLPQAEIIDALRSVIDRVRPEIVYLVHQGDVHTDHRVVFEATMAVLKSFYMRKMGVRRVLSFETLSSTDAAPMSAERMFLPQIYTDISPYLEEKVRIMGLFASEAQPDPMPRGPSALRALARYRGAAIGVEAAEAFMLIREVN